MERKYGFYSGEQFFKTEENMEINGDMYIKNNSQFKDLIVHGNCTVEGKIKATKLIVLGDLKAQSVIAEELYVSGNADVVKLSAYDIKVTQNLKIVSLRTKGSTIRVGEAMKIDNVSGEISQIAVGKLD